MKNLVFTGLLLLAISTLLFYFTTNFEVASFQLSHFMGIMGGIGIGLFIGGIVGYRSKSTSLEAERKKEETMKLQREKQAAAVAEKD